MTEPPRTLTLAPGAVTILDQTRLPSEQVLLTYTGEDGLIEAITRLRVRGAPALGAAAAAAGYLAAERLRGEDNYRALLHGVFANIAAARPTAVNLFRALDGLRAEMARTPEDECIPAAFYHYTESLIAADVRACDSLADHGANLLGKPGVRILTICNSGSLATLGIGTALGVIRRIAERYPIQVWACETRPLLQGSRLTAWELTRLGIPFHLLPDNAAATVLSRGMADFVITGADRIARNGDTANKVGTLTLAALARTYRIPFYVAAPETTLDPATPNGNAIVVEERSPDEVREFAGISVAPADCAVFNPAFDVTPGEWIDAIITDRAVYRQPYRFLP